MRAAALLPGAALASALSLGAAPQRIARSNIPRSRCASSCRSPPAARRTWWRASSPSSSPRRPARPSWSRTGPAPTAWSARRRWRSRAPDGYTLLVTSSSFVVNPSFHKKMPFDVIRDFEPVTNIAATEAYILGVNPKLPAQTVQEFDRARPQAGQQDFVRLARRRQRAASRRRAVQVAHQDPDGARAVPRRGAGAHRAVAGDVQMMFMTPPSSMPYVEAGKIRAHRLCRDQALRPAARRADAGGGRRARHGGALELDRHVRAGQDAARRAGAAARGGAQGGRRARSAASASPGSASFRSPIRRPSSSPTSPRR